MAPASPSSRKPVRSHTPEPGGDPEYRKKGIGTALVRACKYYAYNAKSQSLSVATQKENDRACSFYMKNQFEKFMETTVIHVWINPDNCK